MVYQISGRQQGPSTAGLGWELSRWRRRAECRALQFAQGSAGQRRKYVDALRALIACEGGVGVCDQSGLVEGISRADGDPRGDLFAPALVSDPRNGCVQDGGVLLQDRFDLA